MFKDLRQRLGQDVAVAMGKRTPRGSPLSKSADVGSNNAPATTPTGVLIDFDQMSSAGPAVLELSDHDRFDSSLASGISSDGGRRSRTASTSSQASVDASFFSPLATLRQYTASLVSDAESSVGSEVDELGSLMGNAANLATVTKEDLYRYYCRMQQKADKYRTKFRQVIKSHRELEHEGNKLQAALVESQDKMFRLREELANLNRSQRTGKSIKLTESSKQRVAETVPQNFAEIDSNRCQAVQNEADLEKQLEIMHDEMSCLAAEVESLRLANVELESRHESDKRKWETDISELVIKHERDLEAFRLDAESKQRENLERISAESELKVASSGTQGKSLVACLKDSMLSFRQDYAGLQSKTRLMLSEMAASNSSDVTRIHASIQDLSEMHTAAIARITDEQNEEICRHQMELMALRKEHALGMESIEDRYREELVNLRKQIMEVSSSVVAEQDASDARTVEQHISALKCLRDEHDRTQEKLRSTEGQTELYKAEIEQSKVRIGQLTEQQDVLRQELACRIDELSQLQAEVETMKEVHLQELAKLEMQRTSEVAAEGERMRKAKEDELELERSRHAIELAELTATHRNEVITLSAKLEDIQRLSEEKTCVLEETIEKHRQDSDLVEDELRLLKEVHKILNSDMDLKNTEFSKLESELVSKIEQLEKLASMETNYEEAVSRIELLEASKAELEKLSENNSRTLEESQQEREMVLAEMIAKHGKDVAEIEALRLEIRSVSDDNSSKVVKIRQLENDVKMLNEQLVELKAENTCQLESLLEQHSSEKAALINDLSILKDKISVLEDELERNEQMQLELTGKVSSLELEVAGSETMRLELVAKISSLEEQLERIGKVRDELTNRVAIFEEELACKEQRIVDLTNNMSSCEEELRTNKTLQAELSGQISYLEEELVSSGKAKEESIRTVSYLEEKLADREQLHVELTGKISSLEEELARTEKIKLDLISKDNDLEAQLTKNADMQLELAVRISSLQEELARSEQVVQNLTEKVTSLEDELENGKKMRMELADKVSCLEHERERLKSELSGEVSSIEEELAASERIREELTAKVSALEEKLTDRDREEQVELSARISSLEEELASNEKIKLELTDKCNGLVEERAKSEDMKLELTGRIRSLEVELSRSEQSIVDLTEKVAVLEEALESGKKIQMGLTDKISSQQEELLRNENLRAELSSKVSSLEDELTSSGRMQDELTAQVSTLEEKLADREQLQMELLCKITAMEEELTRSEKIKLELSGKDSCMEEELAKSAATQVELTGRICSLEEELSRSEQRVQNLTEKVTSLEDELDGGRKIQMELTDKVSAFEDEQGRNQQVVLELSGKCSCLEEKLENIQLELTSKVSSLEEEVTRSELIRATLTDRITSLMEELSNSEMLQADLTGRASSLEEELERSEKFVAGLNEKVSNCERELAQTEELLLALQETASSLKAENGCLKDELELRRKKELECSVELESLNRSSEHQTNCLQDQLRAMEMELETKAQKIAELEERHKLTDDREARLDLETEKLVGEVLELKGRNKQIEDELQEIMGRNKMLEQSFGYVSQVERELDTLKQDRQQEMERYSLVESELQTTKCDLLESTNRSSSLFNQLENAERDLREFTDRYASLQSELENANASLSEKSDLCVALENKIQDMSDHRNSVERELESTKAFFQETSDRLSALQSKYEKAKVELREAENHRAALEADLASTQQQAEDDRKAGEEKDAIIRANKTRINELEEKLHEAKQQIQELSSAGEMDKAALDEMMASRFSDLKKKYNNKLKNMQAEHNAKVGSLMKVLEEAQACKVDLESLVGKLESELAEYREKAELTTAHINVLEVRLQDSEAKPELGEAQRRIKELEEVIDSAEARQSEALRMLAEGLESRQVEELRLQEERLKQENADQLAQLNRRAKLRFAQIKQELVAEKESSVAELIRVSDELRARLSASEDELHEMTEVKDRELQARKAEVKSLTDRLAEAQGLVCLKEAAVAENEAKLKSLLLSTACKSDSEAVARQTKDKTEFESLENVRHELVAEITELKAELQEAQVKNTELTKKLHSLEDGKQKLTFDGQQELDRLRTELEQKLRDKEAECSRLARLAEQEKSRLAASYDVDMRTAQLEHQNELARLKSEFVEKVRDTENDHNGKIKQLVKEFRLELAQKEKEFQTNYNAALDKSQREEERMLYEHQKEIQELQKEIREKDNLLDDIRETSDVQMRATEMQYQGDIYNLKDKIKDLESTVMELRSELLSAQSAGAAASTYPTLVASSAAVNGNAVAAAFGDVVGGSVERSEVGVAGDMECRMERMDGLSTVSEGLTTAMTASLIDNDLRREVVLLSRQLEELKMRHSLQVIELEGELDAAMKSRRSGRQQMPGGSKSDGEVSTSRFQALELHSNNLQAQILQQTAENAKLKIRERELQQELRTLRAEHSSSSLSHSNSPSHPAVPIAPTEMEYLKNIMYLYMIGTETQTLSKVICSLLRFSDEQTRNVQQKQ